VIWRIIAFFAIGIAVTGGASLHVARRFGEVVGWDALSRRTRALWLVLFGASALPLLRFSGAPAGVVEIAAVLGFGVGLSCIIASALLAVVDFVSWVARKWAARKARGTVAAPVAAQPSMAGPSVPHPDPLAPAGVGDAARAAAASRSTSSRRVFLRRAGIGASLALGGGTSLYGFAIGSHDYVIEDVPIRLPRLPRALDGYTIAQLSDVHLGTFVRDREIRAARDLARRARADLLVLTGDLLDHDPRYLPELGRLVRALADAAPRDGIVAILGNHDYYAGADDVVATLRAAGVRVLRNEATTLGDAGGRIALCGVDDVWAPRNGYGPGADLPATLAQTDPDHARVLLCHNPELFPTAAAHVDLQLSGHTHGGQVNPIVRPIDLFQPFAAGHYVRGASQLYVNRGFGTVGPPARVGAAPELTRITLVA
jgi:predicted MPP superfamily phosphohydrolase